MKTLVFGANGQLGRSLKDVQPDKRKVIYLARDDCDLSQQDNIRDVLEEIDPDVVINAAAYTAVDKAESEFDVAQAVNEIAVMAMAEYVVSNHAVLMHLSTDFVFDGTKKTPYLPGDQTAPLGVYAETKLAGELVALKTAPESTMIIRTSWVYSEHGNNFVKTMLKLMSERDELNVVDDQIGSPTYARGLAEMIWQILDTDLFKPGIYHWTDDSSPVISTDADPNQVISTGARPNQVISTEADPNQVISTVAQRNGEISERSDRGRARLEGPQTGITWHTFALAIQQQALTQGLLNREIPIHPILTADYPTAAERPSYSVLDNSKMTRLVGIAPQSWQDQLSVMLRNLERF